MAWAVLRRPATCCTFIIAPNITPDIATGIGAWTEQQIATELQAGIKPDGTLVKGLMAEQVAGGYNGLTDADVLAIVAFLKTIPAVSNVAVAPEAPSGPIGGPKGLLLP